MNLSIEQVTSRLQLWLALPCKIQFTGTMRFKLLSLIGNKNCLLQHSRSNSFGCKVIRKCTQRRISRFSRFPSEYDGSSHVFMDIDQTNLSVPFSMIRSKRISINNQILSKENTTREDQILKLMSDAYHWFFRMSVRENNVQQSGIVGRQGKRWRGKFG